MLPQKAFRQHKQRPESSVIWRCRGTSCSGCGGGLLHDAFEGGSRALTAALQALPARQLKQVVVDSGYKNFEGVMEPLATQIRGYVDNLRKITSDAVTIASHLHPVAESHFDREVLLKNALANAAAAPLRLCGLSASSTTRGK